jgi:monoterpene epsilon-lactone hydrolase
VASLRSRVVAALVPLDRGSRYVRDVDALRAHVAPGAKAAPPAPPAWLRRGVRVARGEVAGVRCYRLSPRGGSGAAGAGAQPPRGAPPGAGDGRHVLYLHGGAYVGEISVHHWRFLARLVRAARATITVPIYTLAPHATAPEVVAEVAGVQRELAPPVVMGDSAGAGLALAVAQEARVQGREGPRELVLLSPWVDATMTNPEITTVAPRDPVLGVEAVALAGVLYAGAGGPAGPLASPINGDLAGLGHVTILIGTRDVFLPDSRRLRDGLEAVGTQVTYVEEPDMLHDWMLLPIPEAARAIERLAGTLAGVRPARP